MIDLPHLLGRLLIVALAFLAAVVASLLVIGAGLDVVSAGERLAVDPDLPRFVGLVLRLLRGAAIVPALAVAVWPAWLAAGLIGEALGVRGLIVHLVAGAALAVAGVAATLPGIAAGGLQLAAAAGFVAGFVHWAIAGRSAGLTRRAPPPDGPRGP
ncbi:hypothetical protein EYW49_05285 [Siculibacillus lacustris]|uniref:Uncharacterized protein n=1 Tax=Siculibacillus lacustris TaxID=1549641 RepID=A0A4Q9VW40_9HYPH|nr:hypothetical protein [Siculibacillus lacustris]TBW40080.1 hypothetical protein EYW49_05285 [Siculibacillus lacustris]